MSILRGFFVKVAVFGALTTLFFAIVLVGTTSPAHAAKPRSIISMGGGDSHGSSGQDILLDISYSHVRDVKADGLSDNATRVSIGGMFTSWLGLDLQGSYQTNSKAYLVGADLRIAPVDWFFVKLGGGGFSSPADKALKPTPLGGAGIMARLTREMYLLTEASYFQVDERHNVGFGAGLGIIF